MFLKKCPLINPEISQIQPVHLQLLAEKLWTTTLKESVSADCCETRRIFQVRGQ